MCTRFVVGVHVDSKENELEQKLGRKGERGCNSPVGDHREKNPALTKTLGGYKDSTRGSQAS